MGKKLILEKKKEKLRGCQVDLAVCEATPRTAAEDGSNRYIYADAVQEKISPGELPK